MKKTTALVFDHRNRTREGSPGPVEIRVTDGRRSYYFATGIRVRRQEFVAGRIVGCAGASKMNERVAIVYERVMTLVNDCIERGLPVDKERIRREVWQETERLSDGDTLIDWIHAQIPLLPVGEGTRKHYWPLETRLREFGRLRRWEDLSVERICEFDAFLHALRPVPGRYGSTAYGRLGQGLSDAAIYNYHKCLKALLNRADRYGLIERNPYERLRGQFRRGDRENPEYLTEDEVERIRQLPLVRGSQMERARDLFIFQMFTGLAYSDAVGFDFSGYRQVDGAWRATGLRRKTGVAYVSQLLPPAVEVLQRYGGEVPRLDNADYNRWLKVIGERARCSIALHSHLARHTFATMMLRLGAKIENVSRMLGHTNIVQTQRYAKTLAQSVYEDFDKVSDRWK